MCLNQSSNYKLTNNFNVLLLRHTLEPFFLKFTLIWIQCKWVAREKLHFMEKSDQSLVTGGLGYVTSALCIYTLIEKRKATITGTGCFFVSQYI